MLEHFLAEHQTSANLTDFCSWAVKYSASADPDEYLRSMSNLLLPLCVDIKISSGYSTGACGKMAGNILDFAFQLRDDIDRWTAAVDEDEVERYRGAARRRLSALLDSLGRFDERCSWSEFTTWIRTQQTNRQIHAPFPGQPGADREIKVTIKILFLAANPTDTTRLMLAQEAREIDEALQRAEFRDKFEVEQHGAVQIANLQAYLLRHKPSIVHFSGHGSASNEIILEGISGDKQAVPVHALSELFRILKDNIRCVILNACYTEPQAQAIAEHIDCVIGMSKAISDQAAISFATAFYQALGFGRNVKTAFELGCSEIDLESLGEQETPKLLALKCNPEDIVFVRTD